MKLGFENGQGPDFLTEDSSLVFVDEIRNGDLIAFASTPETDEITVRRARSVDYIQLQNPIYTIHKGDDGRMLLKPAQGKMVTTQAVKTIMKLLRANPELLDIKGPGKGNTMVNAFMEEVQAVLSKLPGVEFEYALPGESKSKFDVYIPDEAAIIEIALSLDKPNSEYEKDILKAFIAKQGYGLAVDCLLFISREGAIKKFASAFRQEVAAFAWEYAQIDVDVLEA